MAKTTKKYKYRSAITGKLVTKAYAEANPDTTVKESKSVNPKKS